MFFCSPAQRKCRHWYTKLIYFCCLLRLVECSPQIVYDIGTKILYFQCFVTTGMFLFCKPIFFSGNCRICRNLAFGSVKTCFKAILKKLFYSAQIDFSAQIYFFHELLPLDGDFPARFNLFMNFCPRRATKVRSLECIYIFNLHYTLRSLVALRGQKFMK